jgi:hypothetical protein
MFFEDFLNSCTFPSLMANSKAWLQKNDFVPWKSLKTIDLSSGSLNYKEMEVLRQVEGEGKKCYHDGVIPCTANIKCTSKTVENKANEIVPFMEFQSERGKGIRFSEARAICTVFDAFALTEKAKRQIVSIY